MQVRVLLPCEGYDKALGNTGRKLGWQWFESTLSQVSCGLDTDVSKSASQVESDSSLRVVHKCKTLLIAPMMFSDDIHSDGVIESCIRAE